MNTFSEFYSPHAGIFQKKQIEAEAALAELMARTKQEGLTLDDLNVRLFRGALPIAIELST